MNYSARFEKNDDHCLDFSFAHASFLLSWRLWRVPFLAHLQNLCATEILEHVIENYYRTLSKPFRMHR
jgi:hypothetical protein